MVKAHSANNERSWELKLSSWLLCGSSWIFHKVTSLNRERKTAGQKGQRTMLGAPAFRGPTDNWGRPTSEMHRKPGETMQSVSGPKEEFRK